MPTLLCIRFARIATQFSGLHFPAYQACLIRFLCLDTSYRGLTVFPYTLAFPSLVALFISLYFIWDPSSIFRHRPCFGFGAFFPFRHRPFLVFGGIFFFVSCLSFFLSFPSLCVFWMYEQGTRGQMPQEYLTSHFHFQVFLTS